MKFRILAILPLFFFINCVKNNTQAPSLLSYVPKNSAVVIQIKAHDAFLSNLTNNTLLQEVNTFEAYQSMLKKLSVLTYVQPKTESILAITETVENNYEFTYITDITPNLFAVDSVKNKVIETITTDSFIYDKYTVDDQEFYSFATNNKIITSSSLSLLKSANETANIAPTPLLQKLYATTSKTTPASLLVNLNKSTSLLEPFFNKNDSVIPSRFSDWVSFDLKANSDNLHVTGIGIANDSLPKTINLFLNTLPVTNSTPLFAPEESNAIASYSFNNYQNFAKNQKFLTNTTVPENPALDAIEEIGIIYMNGKKNILLNTLGGEAISDYLKNDKKSSIEFQGNEIIALQNPDFLNERFNPLVTAFNANFFTIINNAFIFSGDQEDLKTIISNYKIGNTFNKTPIYTTLKETLAQESNVLFVARANKLNTIFKTKFSTDFSKMLKKASTANHAFAAQIIAEKKFYHTNITFKKNEQKASKPIITSLFSLELPNTIVTRPQFVTNHVNKQKDIIVQDENNILYLISKTGKIRWKKQLSSLVQGKIHQVDIFKNGRLQFAFTTNNQFIVLDRNGKELKKFTKTFDGGNLNPLAVFDYEKKKDYRFVITQNNKVFMYNSKATTVKGFKYKKAKKSIIAAPKHFTIAKKDYLVFKLKDGTLKILNRTGKDRVKVKEKIAFSDNEVFLYKNKFTLTDKKGILYRIDTKGKITKTNFNLSSDHGMYATAKTLALMNDNVLTIKGKKATLELGVYTHPKIFYINNKIYVSVTDLQTGKVYLFNSQAKPIVDTPIFGSTPIDLANITGNKQPEILTTLNDKNIIVYKLN